MASSPRINTQLGARQTLELRRKARLPVHRPSACSGDLIAGDGTKNGLSRSEQKTLSTTQNNRLTGKAPYKSTTNLTTDDVTGPHSSVSTARHRLRNNRAPKQCTMLARFTLLPAGASGAPEQAEPDECRAEQRQARG